MIARKVLFFLFLALFLLADKDIKAQYSLEGKSLRTLKTERIDFSRSIAPAPTPFLIKNKENLPDFLTFSPLPKVHEVPRIYRFDELGMFCKFEVQIEKATRFPVKIRLGEVEAVDRKEGKWQYDNGVIH